jgi:hypothetical protein
MLSGRPWVSSTPTVTSSTDLRATCACWVCSPSRSEPPTSPSFKNVGSRRCGVNTECGLARQRLRSTEWRRSPSDRTCRTNGCTIDREPAFTSGRFLASLESWARPNLSVCARVWAPIAPSSGRSLPLLNRPPSAPKSECVNADRIHQRAPIENGSTIGREVSVTPWRRPQVGLTA